MSVRVERLGAVALVTIARPEAANAIDAATHEELTGTWPGLERDDSVRVIVLTGGGAKAFCTGADIVNFLPYLGDLIAQGQDPEHFCGLTMTPLRKPIIAAINGAALGGGLELALACDLRIASDNATFGLPEPRIGLIAGAGGVTRLARAVPEAIAMDMLLTGRIIDARRAYEIGLVSEIAPAGKLLERVLDAARLIAENGPIAVRQTRDTILRSRRSSLADALSQERAAFRETMMSSDASEGIAAFQEKRRPRFSGR
jgi:enoyl-CoA hydratase/carnithine racemase